MTTFLPIVIHRPKNFMFQKFEISTDYKRNREIRVSILSFNFKKSKERFSFSILCSKAIFNLILTKHGQHSPVNKFVIYELLITNNQ